MTFGRRILILVAHPDDEVVGFCACIGRARAEGARIFTLYLTHGCVTRDSLWPWQKKHYDAFVVRRRAEAENAAIFLNITPVGWGSRAARMLWQDLPTVHKEIDAAIRTHAIDQLWVSAYEGGNPDHDALNAMASIYRKRIDVLEFAEYNYMNAKSNAQTFPFPHGQETTHILTPDEQTHKSDALKLYASEKNNLGYVGLSRECYRSLVDYDYSQSPHPGILWYARFQWVPFRHPRVDFTKPHEVSTAITTYLNSLLSPACESNRSDSVSLHV